MRITCTQIANAPSAAALVNFASESRFAGGTGFLTASLRDPVSAGCVLQLREYGDASPAKVVE